MSGVFLGSDQALPSGESGHGEHSAQAIFAQAMKLSVYLVGVW